MAVGLKKRRRIQLIIAGFLCLGLAFGAIYFAAGDAFQYFKSPSEVKNSPPETDEIFKMGGIVVEGSLRQNGTTYSFDVSDGEETVPVTFTGVKPDLFCEGQAMIGTGRLVAGIFVATEILAKHDENYVPKEVADTLKDEGMLRPNC